MFCMIKEKKYMQLIFQDITQIEKKNYFFNDFEQALMASSYRLQ